MAEEKKTTTRKKATEEVNVEKRFCTNCGKELNAGEVCDCKEEEVSINVDTEALAKLGKGFLGTLINMFKKPFRTVNANVAKKDVAGSIIMLVVISLSFGILMMAGMSAIDGLFEEAIGMSLFAALDIDGIQVLITMMIVYFILAFIPITVSFVIARVTKNNHFNYKSAISLYATSMAPSIITNLVVSLIFAIELGGLGLIVLGIAAILCFFHYVLGYLSVNTFEDNQKAYILTIFMVAWMAVYYILNLLLAE